MTKGPDATAGATKNADRLDHVISFPLILLFYPDSDPTEKFPGQSVDLEGYVVGPDRTVTIAATTEGTGALELLDSVWNAIRRKGVGRRHMVVLNERGQTVSVMTLDVAMSEESIRLLRSLLIVPVHARAGVAEVHFLASPEEVEVLEERVEKGGHPLPAPSSITLPPARETGVLEPEDWGFLGLLSSIGAFDESQGFTPELVADLLGVDPVTFVEHARTVEHDLQGLVTGLFAVPEPGSLPGGLPS